MQHTLKFFINICFLFVVVSTTAQEETTTETSTKKDTIIYKSNFGLRLGVDISKPIQGLTNNTYSGYEIVGDYRISKRFFIAAELGFEEKISEEDFTNSTAKGSYARLGFNYNAYQNWLDMNNEVYVGYRYGYSMFEQTLNNFTPNVNSLYFPAAGITTPITATNLNAHWSELLFGIKVETINNLFVGFSVSYKILMSVKDPANFKTLYAPGFNRIFETNTGFGFNYSISYLIPFRKK